MKQKLFKKMVSFVQFEQRILCEDRADRWKRLLLITIM